MCGRFALWSDKNRLISHYGLSDAAWLHEGGVELLKPCTGEVETCRVSGRVNNPRHQGEVLVQPL